MKIKTALVASVWLRQTARLALASAASGQREHFWWPRRALVSLSLHSAARLTLAVALAAGALAPRPATALETSDLVGWWIALDDTLPKLWKQGAIKAQDQVVQINADGTVSDRVMNFWAGGAQACLDSKVCSDLPGLATAKIAVNSNRVSFSEVDADPGAARLGCRQSADPAGGGDRDPRMDRARSTASASRCARPGCPRSARWCGSIPTGCAGCTPACAPRAWSPEDHWRCFLGNATAGDGAFAPLRAGALGPRAGIPRPLSEARVLHGALRSAAALPTTSRRDDEGGTSPPRHPRS